MDDNIDIADERPGWLRRIRRGATAVGDSIADLALPPQCLACDRHVARLGGLCPVCWGEFRLIERPYCERLGIPFAYDLGPGALSAEAIADPPPFDRCRAVAHFDEVARKLVHGLKYRDHVELARWMGGWMARAGADVVADADIVDAGAAPPLPAVDAALQPVGGAGPGGGGASRKPLRAGACSGACGRRRSRSACQRRERDKNVRGAFRVMPEERPEIAGRRVLLVDDVYTTGATVKAATRALLRGGAGAVDVLVFARVVRGGD